MDPGVLEHEKAGLQAHYRCSLGLSQGLGAPFLAEWPGGTGCGRAERDGWSPGLGQVGSGSSKADRSEADACLCQADLPQGGNAAATGAGMFDVYNIIIFKAPWSHWINHVCKRLHVCMTKQEF